MKNANFSGAYVSCGNSEHESCFESYCTDYDELHAVRCCSDTEIAGYQQQNGCEIWAESQIASYEDGEDSKVIEYVYEDGEGSEVIEEDEEVFDVEEEEEDMDEDLEAGASDEDLDEDLVAGASDEDRDEDLEAGASDVNEGLEEGNVNKEQAEEESEEAAEWYASNWWEQDGDDSGIPKKYTPCAYFFKARHSCQNETCQFSHTEEIFREEPIATFLKNLSWGRKGRKAFARPPPWNERKKHRRADEEDLKMCKAFTVIKCTDWCKAFRLRLKGHLIEKGVAEEEKRNYLSTLKGKTPPRPKQMPSPSRPKKMPNPPGPRKEAPPSEVRWSPTSLAVIGSEDL